MGVKHKVNEDFFDAWNSEMAYVFGYWCADGNILDASDYMRGKYISVISIDKETITNFKSILNSEHKIIECVPYGNRQKQYLLKIGSHQLYDALVRRGLTPHKSLTMKFPEVPKGYLSDFVRGYFDGDGCVHIERGRGNGEKIILKRLRTIFTSGSRKFLADLMSVLARGAGLKSGKVFSSHRSFQLIYPTTDSLTLFKFMYRNVRRLLFLKRKYATFRQYFKMRPIRVDMGIAKIIRWVNNGHVVK